MFSDFSRAHAIRVMETLTGYPCAKLFIFPVNSQSEGTHDYYHIIKRPMDITTIMNNLLNGKYRNFSEWKRDVYQIYQNSKTFNGSDSYITAMAAQFIKHFDREFDSFFSYDSKIWTEKYQKISNKLDNLIQNTDLSPDSEFYQKAIDASQKGQKMFQSISTKLQESSIQPKILSKSGKHVTNEVSFRGQNTSFPLKSNGEFVSPPEISDETKGGINPQRNSLFPSFELSTSNAPSEKRQSQSDMKYTSIFQGIDMLNLPPKIVFSDAKLPIQPNMNSNAPIQPEKKELPSIFGNVQFDSFPPVFNSPFQKNDSDFLPSKTEEKFKIQPEIPDGAAGQKCIPLPIFIPVPEISQKNEATNNRNVLSNSFSNDFEINREKISSESKKDDSFENSGFIDVTDYF